MSIIFLKKVISYSKNRKLSKLQVLSFMFTPNYRRCPLPLKLIGFVLYVLKILHVMSFRPNPVNFFC
ncbi:hypothetical protein Hdeb2414_s0025g00664201 [Helianthus debilis subsp. tardiflorus]